MINSEPYDWHIKLNLINWNTSTKWTKPARILPLYLLSDGFLFQTPLTTTFYWQQKSSIIIIRLPVRGEPIERFRNMYHTIRINSTFCPPEFSYLEDYYMNITEILKPFDNFDSCFIMDNTKILCVGQKGISSYDIDFDKTKVRFKYFKHCLK